MIFPLVLILKLLITFNRFFNLGHGSTWPGEIALFFFPNIFSHFAGQLKKGLIIIAGTNGKTTTAKMVEYLLAKSITNKKRILHNDSGANLLNGLISAFIQKSSLTGELEADFAVFEVDEATVPLIISNLKSQSSPARNCYAQSVAGGKPQLKTQNFKTIIVFLNLFRDQLDRYGEVDTIARKWKKALQCLPKEATLILNADDPQIAYLGKNTKAKVVYFGIERTSEFLPKVEHATDSIFCLSCRSKLSYKGVYFSHIGVWFCPKCGNRRPKLNIKNWPSPLPGLYNQYNTQAAVSVVKALEISDAEIKENLKSFSPAFGRQEEFVIDKKKIKIFLSKNPAGFNVSLRTVLEQNPKVILLVLNDQIPDGRDVSWIWDVDFEMIPSSVQIIVSGERVYDMALRVKYARKFQNSKFKIYENLKEAIYTGLKDIDKGETLYILPTYSAMLQVRKILGGRKIL